MHNYGRYQMILTHTGNGNYNYTQVRPGGYRQSGTVSFPKKPSWNRASYTL